MSEILEMPELGDLNIMELTVCGRLRTKTPTVKRLLNQIKSENVARIGGKRSDQYLDVFGNGRTNHLHVDVVFRSPEWASEKELVSLNDLKMKVMKFAGIPIKATISGTFFVPISDLPKNGLVRSAMDETKHGGVTARKTAQTLSISDGPIRELRWQLIPVEKDDLVEVEIVANKDTLVNAEYLQECEALVVRAFNALILGGKTGAANAH